MLADERHRRPGALRRADAGGAGHVVPGAAGRGRVHRLDRLAPAPTCTTTRTSPSAWTCYQAGPSLPDLELRENQVIRIYDIVFDYENLLGTDRFYRTLCRGEAFQQTMGTAEFHNLVGKYLAEREDADRPQGQEPARGRATAAACRSSPVSPGDSSIGMNLAALQLEGSKLRIDPLRDVNQTAAIVWDAKASGGTSGVFILGGGSPKNFMLQTEPQIQEVLGLAEAGHDYFLQFTDARPDTGGLSRRDAAARR